MKCLKCQFDNRNGVKFCEKCGAEMEIDCPDCGAKIPLGREFCGQCGKKLAEFVETEKKFSKLKVSENMSQSFSPTSLDIQHCLKNWISKPASHLI